MIAVKKPKKSKKSTKANSDQQALEIASTRLYNQLRHIDQTRQNLISKIQSDFSVSIRKFLVNNSKGRQVRDFENMDDTLDSQVNEGDSTAALPCAIIVAGAVNFSALANIFEAKSEQTPLPKDSSLVQLYPTCSKNLKCLLDTFCEQLVTKEDKKQFDQHLHTFSNILRVLTKKLHGRPPVVINLQSIESFNGEVLSDFLNLLHANQDQLPVVLVFSVASMLSSFTRILTSSVLAKLKISKMNLPPANIFLRTLLDELLFKQATSKTQPEEPEADSDKTSNSDKNSSVKDQFYLDKRIYLNFTDRFMMLDHSIDHFLNGTKFAMVQQNLARLKSKKNELFDESRWEAFEKAQKRYYLGVGVLFETTKPHLGNAYHVTFRNVYSSVELTRVNKWNAYIADLGRTGAKELKVVVDTLGEQIMNHADHIEDESIDCADFLVEKIETLELIGRFLEHFDANDEEIWEYLNITDTMKKQQQQELQPEIENQYDKTTNVHGTPRGVLTPSRSTKSLQKMLMQQALEKKSALTPSRLTTAARTAARSNAATTPKVQVFNELRTRVVKEISETVEKLLEHPARCDPEIYGFLYYGNIGAVKDHWDLDLKAVILRALAMNDPYEFFGEILSKPKKPTGKVKDVNNNVALGVDYDQSKIFSFLNECMLSPLNMYDWCSAFSATIGEEYISEDAFRKFMYVVNVLKLLGIVKNNSRRTDHLDRLVWQQRF